MSTPPADEQAPPGRVSAVAPVNFSPVAWPPPSQPLEATAYDPGLAGPSAAAPAPSVAPPRRHRLWFWIAIVLALAGLAVGSYLTVVTYRESKAPQTVAGDYLATVASGDAAAALAFGELPEPGGFTADPRALLTDAVLRAQLDIAPMSSINVGSVDIDGDTATAHVTYRLGFDAGGVTVDDTIPMSRDGRSWRLDAPAVKVALALDRANGRASLAGAVVPRGPYYLFPGAMPIALDTDALQLTEDSRVVSFETAAAQKVQDVELSPHGVEAFGAAIDAAMTTCLEGSADEPTLCPVPGDYRAVPGTMRGTLATPSADSLEFKVQPGPQGNILALGELSIDGTYEQLDFNNQRVTKDIEGPVRVTVLANATDVDEIVWEFL